MAITIDGTNGITNVDGSAANPAYKQQDSNTGVSGSADQLVLSTAGTERLRVASAGQLGVAGANYGTDGQVLTSTGASSAPAWETLPGGGITEADSWRLTDAFNGSATPIATNLARSSTKNQVSLMTANSGSGMTVSSGIFTFPDTGWWYITYQVMFITPSSQDSVYNYLFMQSTENNSSYGTVGEAYTAFDGVSGTAHYSSIFGANLLKISNTSNDKVKFNVETQSSNVTVQGLGQDSTAFKFIRLAGL